VWFRLLLFCSVPILIYVPDIRPAQLAIRMCDYTKNYYIYASCIDPGAHFFGTSLDGKKEDRCSKSPHERYIVMPGHCPLCST
jgi:hypothetical protein